MNRQQMWSQMKAAINIMQGNRAFGGPVQANLNAINRCNMRCIHCFYNSPYLDTPALRILRKEKREKHELPDDGEVERIMNLVAGPDRIRALMDEIIDLGTRRFQFCGMGEVSLNKNIL